MNRGTRILLALLLLSTSALAGTYQIVYEEQIDGAEGYVGIDALEGASNELTGFVFLDSVGMQVLVTDLSSIDTKVFQLENRPYAATHRWSASRGVLTVYCVHAGPKEWEGPVISELFVEGDSSWSTSIQPPVYWTVDHDLYDGYLKNDIRIVHREGMTDRILYECTMAYYGFIMTFGPYSGTRSTSIEYSPNLESLYARYNATSLCVGNLMDDPQVERYYCLDYYYTWNFQDYPGDPNYGTVDWTQQIVSASDGLHIVSQKTYNGASFEIFMDDFIEYFPYDEVIYYGAATDLMELHEAARHVACYNFRTGTPEEIWYQPLSGVSLDYVYKPQRYIAGMRGKNKMIALGFETGLLVDSVDLGRELDATRFFESEGHLNIVGRSHDTIFVYRFDTPTDTPEDDEPLLPVNYHLAQNYPNPFNPSTTIQFDVPVQSHVTVEVFNILGQQVTTLADEEYSAGNHSVTWDATDVSSGVYLYRLVTDGYSETRKMVLLK